MDKQLIAERFARARNTYAREARVQQQVAVKMMRMLTDSLLSESCPPKEFSACFPHIVEFGCGTGSYSRLIIQTLQPETLLLNDLCREMEECLNELCRIPGVSFRPGDAEELDFPAHTNLITSCSTLQWFANPSSFFARCHRSLTENGLLAFSTFGTENMCQIRQLTGHGLSYLTIEQLQSLLSPEFDILHAEEEVISLSFETPLHVLKHLKETGVTGTEKKIWTRSRLQHFCNEYTRLFSETEGFVTLTYHPIYIIARKRTITNKD